MFVLKLVPEPQGVSGYKVQPLIFVVDRVLVSVRHKEDGGLMADDQNTKESGMIWGNGNV